MSTAKFAKPNRLYHCCCCCPVYILTLGRIIAVILLSLTSLGVAFAVADRRWVNLAAVLFINAPINIAFTYGVFKKRRGFLLPFIIIQAAALILTVIGMVVLLAMITAEYPKFRQQLDERISVSSAVYPLTLAIIYGMVMVIMIVVNGWMLHIGWRCYYYLKFDDKQNNQEKCVKVDEKA